MAQASYAIVEGIADPNKISELLKREQLIDSLPSPDTNARPFEVPMTWPRKVTL